MPTLTLGDFELSIFSDGIYRLDGGAFFGVIPISNDAVLCQANLGDTSPATLLVLQKRHFALSGSF